MIILRMKKLREALGLSMPQFGKRLGCSRDVVANIEYGRVEPKEVFLNHVCEIYNVNHEWLFAGRGHMFADGDGDERVREAMEIFRTLSPDLRDLALSQLVSLQKLMKKSAVAQAGAKQENLDTIRLMSAMLGAHEFDQVKGKTGKIAEIGARLRERMEAQGVSLSEVVTLSGLAEAELKRMLDDEGGVRRDSLIAAGIALSLDVEEMQRLLTAAGLPALYAQNRRDSACIFALMKGLDMKELNDLLAELEETAL